LHSGTFDLVILSVMLSDEEKHLILVNLPAGTRTLVMETVVLPEDLLRPAMMPASSIVEQG
jgi:hypothetical protein